MANAEVEAVDFEPEDDDLMDEDGAVDVDASPKAPIPKLKSAITGGSSSAPKKIKGRGFREAAADSDRNARMSGRFDSLYSDGGPGPERCRQAVVRRVASTSSGKERFWGEDRDREREIMANAEVEAVDFEPEDDDLMDEDGAVDVDASPKAPIPKLKSAITGGSSSAPKKIKGRGFREAAADSDRNARMSGRFDSLYSDGGPGPERCRSIIDSIIIGINEAPLNLIRGAVEGNTILLCAPMVMVDGNRGQEAKRLEDTVCQLKDSSDKQATALDKQVAAITGLANLVVAMNLKYDQLHGHLSRRTERTYQSSSVLPRFEAVLTKYAR
ncbi:unnamed protein product [Ilex paraguariensis]|uniref:Uncharacterized protein n=1 Tax=Ilex paraguariensis TaxID=185542 RepID=A0ABC8U531_9AQUA